MSPPPPSAPRPADAAVRDPSPPPPAAQLHVLVVSDDEGGARARVAGALSAVEGTVYHVRHVREADAELAGGRYDVALIDAGADVEAGLRLLRDVEGRGVLKPLILLTSGWDRAAEEAAVRAGAADTLAREALQPLLIDRAIRYAVERCRHEAEREELLERERHARSELARILESVTDAFFAVDRGWRFTYVNAGAERQLRRPRGALLGRRLWDELPEAADSALWTECHRAVETGETVEFELFYAPLDGWFAARAYPSADGLSVFFRNVTGRKEAEARLQAGNELLRTFLDTLPDHAWLKDAGGRYRLVNRAYTEARGLPPERILGLTDHDLFPAEAAERFVAGDREAMELAERVVREEPCDLGGGAAGVWETSKAPVRAATGEIVGTVGISRDVTERCRTEEALRESEARYRRLVEQATDSIFLHDVEGRILDVNPHACESLGYTREELLSLRIQDIDPGLRDVPPPWSRVDRGTPVTVAAVHRRRDGGTYPVEVRLGRIGPESEPQILAVARDVTERREAEEALRRTTETLAALVDALPVAVIGLDRELRVTLWNPAAERMFGWRADEVVGGPYPLVPPGREEEQRRLVHAERELGEPPAGYETQRLRRDGSLVDTAIWSAVLRDAEGNVQESIGVCVDMTEHRRLAERLHQAQRMEAVGRLAGGVAHDFNNILTVISTSADFLLEDLPEGSAEREDAAEIRRAAGRAAELTRQLLAFSRKQVLRPRVLDLNDLISQTGKMLRRVIGEDVEVVTRLAPEIGRVEADPGQIEQVLMNLAVNARDAMPGGGTLTVETRPVEIDARSSAFYPHLPEGTPAVLLSVSDTGVGIAPEAREHVFDPFFTTKEKGKGTGLGLSTVYGIVKQSRGYIWVDSEVGRGTTFHVVLPRVDRPADEPDPDPSGRPAGRRGTILVVEDEEAVARMVRRVLERCGYVVHTATGGAEALRLAERAGDSLDLVVTDVVMPGMNGRELGERIGASHDVPVLFVSGYTDDVIGRHGVLDAGVRFLQKPFSPDDLARTVDELLGAEGEREG